MGNLSMIDLDAVEDTGGDFQPLPAGEYEVLIESAEVKPNAANTGQICKIGYKVEGPNFIGRVLWDNLNVVNHNQTAQNIGRAELKQVANAVGLDQVEDSQLLIGKRLAVRVAIEKRRDTGENVNRIKKRHARGPWPVAPAPQGDPLAPKQPSPGIM